MTTLAPPIQFLYLVASGNDDSIYKIGISDDPERRLGEIQKRYNVPNAFIVETMDVNTRETVFALENALHERFAESRSNLYGGREWFRLTDQEVTGIKRMYTQESNAYSQATAYFGLWERLNKAENGDLHLSKSQHKRLLEKCTIGHLAQRFQLKVIDHPLKAHLTDVRKKIAVAASKSKDSSVQILGTGVGVVVGTIAGLSIQANAGVVTAIIGGVTGFGMALSHQDRLYTDRVKDIYSKVTEEFYKVHDKDSTKQTLVAICDTKEKRTYLVKDFNETNWYLRGVRATIPAVIGRNIDPYLQQAAKPQSPKGSWLLKTIGTVFISNALLVTLATAEERSRDDRYSNVYAPPSISRIVNA